MDPTKYQTEVHAFMVQYMITQKLPGVTLNSSPEGTFRNFTLGGMPVIPGAPFSDFLPGLKNMLRTSQRYGSAYTPTSADPAFKKGAEIPE
jgi:hypothetical protein